MLLLNQLESTINLYVKKLDLDKIGGNYRVELKVDNIPIQRIFDEKRVIYGSAIALKLASQYKLAPLEIATQLATYLETTTDYNNNAIILDFIIEVSNSGWIYFNLTNSSIAVWLQHLLEISETFFDHFKIPEAKNIKLKPNFSFFQIQYTHARCCSLLRLGEQEGLIEMSRDNHQGKFYIVEPKPIPWLNGGLIAAVFGNPTPALPEFGEGAGIILSPPVSGQEIEFYSLHLIEQLLDLLDELSAAKFHTPSKGNFTATKAHPKLK